ncbi:MAG: hypothetical protein ACTSW1_14980 [Candidatus Hodarchaeales archaeon]
MNAVIEEVNLEEIILKIRQDSEFEVKIKSGWRIAGFFFIGILGLSFLTFGLLGLKMILSAQNDDPRGFGFLMLAVALFDAVLLAMTIRGSAPSTITIDSNGEIFGDHIFKDLRDKYVFSHIELSIYKRVSKSGPRYRKVEVPFLLWTYQRGVWIYYSYSVRLVSEEGKRFTVYRDTSKEDVLKLTYILSHMLQLPVVEVDPEERSPYLQWIKEVESKYPTNTPRLSFKTINIPRNVYKSTGEEIVVLPPKENLPLAEVYRNTPVRPMSTLLMVRKTASTYLNNFVRLWIPFFFVITCIALFDVLFFNGKLYGLEFYLAGKKVLFPFMGLFVASGGSMNFLIHILVIGPFYSMVLVITFLRLKDMAFGQNDSLTSHISIILGKIHRLYPVLVLHQFLVQIGLFLVPFIGFLITIFVSVFVVFSYAVVLEENVSLFAIPVRLLELSEFDKNKTLQMQVYIGLVQFIMSVFVLVMCFNLFGSNIAEESLYAIVGILSSIFAPLSGIYPFYLYYDRYYLRDVRLKVINKSDE